MKIGGMGADLSDLYIPTTRRALKSIWEVGSKRDKRDKLQAGDDCKLSYQPWTPQSSSIDFQRGNVAELH